MVEFENGSVFQGANRFCASPIVTVGVLINQVIERQEGHVFVETFLTEQQLVPLPRSDWPSEIDLAQEPGLGLCLLAAHWARSILNEVRGSIGASGACKEGQKVWTWVGYHDVRLSNAVLEFAITCIFDAYAGRHFDGRTEAQLKRLLKVCRVRHPDYQACIVMEAARARGIPYGPAWGRQKFWRFGEGIRSRVLMESSSSVDGAFGTRVARSKILTKHALMSLGLPVPKGVTVQHDAEINAAIETIGFPCVTKPTNLGGGKGVSAGLQDAHAIKVGLTAAREYGPGPVLIEQFVPGDDYRIMVVDGVMVAGIRRDPPFVIGDGKQSVRALVAQINATRFPNSLVRSRYHRPVQLDESALLHLSSQSVTPNSIPAPGQRITLRSNANLSTGGTCTDVTHAVHPNIRFMAESLAASLDMSMLGVDYITTDISRSPYVTGGRFIEINTTPGLDAMIAAGWSIESAGNLCLLAQIGPVPKAVLVVPDSAIAQLRMDAGQLSWPPGMGWATYGASGLDGVSLSSYSEEPSAALQALLQNRRLRAAVIFLSAGEIDQYGLPIEQVDYMAFSEVLESTLQAFLCAQATDVNINSAHTTPIAMLNEVIRYLEQKKP